MTWSSFVDRRPSRLDMLMEMASVVAKRSTCNRLHVGAVLAKDGRILSMGYNGPVSGAPHCKHIVDSKPRNTTLSDHVSQGCQDSVHAEANALIFAAREGISVKGAQLYVTHQPCLNCAQLIINSGITTITYDQPYRLDDGLNLLKLHNVRCLPYERQDS